jgi:FAD dependent oxidoreductase TIGR03364
MDRHYDVVVIGGGIIGLAQAWMASERGLKVLLLERDSKACGASVRNFGMIWPIGQPAGRPHEIALRSRERWMQLAASGVVELENCGSIHAAHNEDEWDVLQEFAALQTHPVQLITGTEVTRRQPVVNPTGLYGGLYSDTEIRVDPRVASAKIGAWLDSQPQVTCRYDTPVIRVDYPSVYTGEGEEWTADHIVICSGSDLKTLYGDVFRSSGLRLCKLQMLKTQPLNNIQANTPHLASGLTLRHYTSFSGCRSLERVKHRIKTESPELDHFGIHVMASVFPSGEIILGDSHEYDEAITPFDRSEIDQLMIRELRKLICLPDWTMAEHWHGIYAKHPDLLIFETLIDEGVHVFVGPGGAGMTMSFGLADDAWDRWL